MNPGEQARGPGQNRLKLWGFCWLRWEGCLPGGTSQQVVFPAGLEAVFQEGCVPRRASGWWVCPGRGSRGAWPGLQRGVLCYGRGLEMRGVSWAGLWAGGWVLGGARAGGACPGWHLGAGFPREEWPGQGFRLVGVARAGFGVVASGPGHWR